VAQPVEVGNALIAAARAAATESHRSMAAQIGHWVLPGRPVEKSLTVGEAVALKRSEGQLDANARARIAQALNREFTVVGSAAETITTR
jgi:ParD-like antitoxin of type II bacterial toxin-antitoxin system